MVLILIIIMLIIFNNVFAHKLYYYAYDSNVAGSFSKQLSCSEDTNAHAQLIPRGCINEYTYKNGVQFEVRS